MLWLGYLIARVPKFYQRLYPDKPYEQDLLHHHTHLLCK